MNLYVCCFLDCVNVVDGKAETIVNEIKILMTEKQIPMDPISSLASDGASVMTGQHNGVGEKLRKDLPHLVQIHLRIHWL